MTSVSLLGHRREGLGDDFFTHATSARVYHYLLGGCENYAADREVARAVWGAADWVKTAALINRDFLLRSVEFSLRLGVRQFLDLGCGYPTAVNVYEITQKTHPTQPVVYVDRDPGVYAHARTQLDERPGVTVLRADILAMDELLACEAMRTAVNLEEPVAVLVGDVLPWCLDDAAVHRATASLRTWMPPGSTLSLSHLTDHWHRATMPMVVAAYAEHGLHIRPRSREEVFDLFGDFIQQKQGLTATGRWHEAGPHALRPEEHSAAFAGITVKPASRSPRKAGLAASRPRSEEPSVIHGELGPGKSQHLRAPHHPAQAGAVPVSVRRAWGLPDLPTAQLVAGNYLRYLRDSHGLRVSDVCGLIGVSHSEMTRIESGSRPLAQQQAHTLLAGPYQVSPAAREGFDRYLYEASFMPQGVMVDADAGWPDRLAALEHRAVAGRIYAERLIPGVLRTPRYTASIQYARDPGNPQITRPTSIGAPAMMVVLEEAVLMRRHSDLDVWAEQLQHLIEAVQAGGICVRILPVASPVHGEIAHLTELVLPDGTRLYAVDEGDVTYRSGLHTESGLGAFLDRVIDAALPEAESYTCLQHAVNEALTAAPLRLP